MPELPDVEIYVERLNALVRGRSLLGVRLKSPFLLRTVDPPLAKVHGKRVLEVRRLGKRVVIGLEDELFLVIHLMIAGRLRWRPPGARITGRDVVAAFDFDNGTLLFTEASKKKRASLHVVRGASGLSEHDRGGIEPLTASRDEMVDALRRERHTLKRSLTDPRLFSGIGYAYSDEILHRARLSPVAMSTSLTDEELDRLFHAIRDVLTEWVQRTRGRRRRRRLPREGHRVPGRDGGPRPIPAALPGLRRPRPAHRVCRERDPLLRHLPDRRPPARRSRPVPAAQERLASHARGTRGPQAGLTREGGRPDRRAHGRHGTPTLEAPP